LKLLRFKAFVILLMYSWPLTIVGQTFQEKADSLLSVLTPLETSSKKVDLLNELSYSYRRINSEMVFQYASQAFEMAIGIDYLKGAAVAKKNQGISFHNSSSPIDSAKKYYTEAIEFSTLSNDYYTQAACHNNIALLHNRKREFYTSLGYYLKAIEIFDEHDVNDNRLKGLLFANTSETYIALKENEKAYSFIFKAFEIAEQYKYRSILSFYADDYGKILTNLGQYEKAKYILDNGLKINRVLDDKVSEAQILNQKAQLEIELGNLDYAIKLAKEALLISKNQGINNEIYNANINLAQIARLQKKYKESIELCHLVINETINIDSKNYEQSARKQLSLSLEAIGEVKEALRELKIYNSLQEEIIGQEKMILISDSETRYKVRALDQAITQLERKETLDRKYIQGLSIFSFFALIACGLIFYLLWKTRKNKKEISLKNLELKKYIDSNLQLENFAYIASHDLKTPLRTIVSFSQLLKKKAGKTLQQENLEYLSYIEQGTKEMSTIVDDLLKYSEVDRQELKREQLDAKDIIQSVIDENHSVLKENNSLIELELKESKFFGDRNNFEQVFQNLILNAVKFKSITERPKILVTSIKNKNEIVFEIKDNGIGIEQDYFDKIFLIFKKLNKKEVYQGSGIGLAICKKIIELHQGKIWVESQIGEGTSFFFSIPVKSYKAVKGSSTETKSPLVTS